MRVVGYIEHPNMKISIFKMDNKFSVKFEGGLCEQIFKFREDTQLDKVEDVKKMITSAFVESVEKRLVEMQDDRFAISQTLFLSGADEFEEII
jgi:hypothetical protein